jgi:uncharacterized protein DUF3750
MIKKFDWRTADRSSAGLAPRPRAERRAVVQLYAARAVRWRGWFAVHAWLSVKEQDADAYTVLQVVGWRLWQGLSPVIVERGEPDRRWFGATPDLILYLRGPAAESAIPKILAAAASYPYPHAYRIWPGPNSNTFISHILRSVPELGVNLPPNAIGRDYLAGGRILGVSESRTGLQLSLFGLLGVTLGWRDGLELQFLGLDFGVDWRRPALKLPIIGRLGLRPAPAPAESSRQEELSSETAAAAG